MEDNDAEHCDGMLVAGNEPGVVRQVLLARPNLSSPEDCNVFKLWEKLRFRPPQIDQFVPTLKIVIFQGKIWDIRLWVLHLI